jgi:hypothetical protein
MLLYALLDVMMTDGLPWKARQGPRLSRGEMRDEKMRLRGYTGDQQSVTGLVRALQELDSTRVHDAPPYRRVEDAIRDAWECEGQERGSALPSRLFDCIVAVQRK